MNVEPSSIFYETSYLDTGSVTYALFRVEETEQFRTVYSMNENAVFHGLKVGKRKSSDLGKRSFADINPLVQKKKKILQFLGP